jgi:hypothetical protein
VSTPRVRYIRACPPTNQSQDAKKGEISKFKISKQIINLKKMQKFYKISKLSKISQDFKIFKNFSK